MTMLDLGRIRADNKRRWEHVARLGAGAEQEALNLGDAAYAIDALLNELEYRLAATRDFPMTSDEPDEPEDA